MTGDFDTIEAGSEIAPADLGRRLGRLLIPRQYSSLGDFVPTLEEDVAYYPSVMPEQPVLAKDRLIVALDVSDVEEALRLVEELEGVVHFFKVGLTLQLAPNVEDLISRLLTGGKKVFLDYKYYDIPATIETAVGRAVTRGVSFLTVHGSTPLMEAAVRARGNSDLKLFTVTVLTSMDATDLQEMGYGHNTTVADLVLFRASKALQAGCDGVIASGEEASKIKSMAASHGKSLLVVTPGIRHDGSLVDDQKRRTTPSAAIMSGADYLVMGRPIYRPQLFKTPREAAMATIREMQEAFDRRMVQGLTAS
jgi:orotidine-5'-phosphate decarboxylase